MRELASLLTHKPVDEKHFSKWWPNVHLGTTDFNELLVEAASCWRLEITCTADHLSDTSLSLWSMLLTLKLISLTFTQSQIMVPEAIAVALWQVLRIFLQHFCDSLTQTSTVSLNY